MRKQNIQAKEVYLLVFSHTEMPQKFVVCHFQVQTPEHGHTPSHLDFFLIKGVFKRTYCCYGNLLCQKSDDNVFTNDWAVF